MNKSLIAICFVILGLATISTTQNVQEITITQNSSAILEQLIDILTQDIEEMEEKNNIQDNENGVVSDGEWSYLNPNEAGCMSRCMGSDNDAFNGEDGVVDLENFIPADTEQVVVLPVNSNFCGQYTSCIRICDVTLNPPLFSFAKYC